MTGDITIAGVVATTVKDVTTSEGLRIASFRLASNVRRYDRKTGRWIDGDTNWFTITAFRRLAEHVAGSFEKGQRVLVHGRLRVRAWESGPRSGTTVEIEAESAGHDLRWGTTAFTRARAPESAPRPEPEDRDVPPPDVASPEPALAEAPAAGLLPHDVPAGAGWASPPTDIG